VPVQDRHRPSSSSSSRAPPWIKAFGVHYAVGVDGIALVLIAMSAVLVPVVHDRRLARRRPAGAGRRTVKILRADPGLETHDDRVFAATDVFLFYVFFEAMLIPMYFLIGSFGGPRALSTPR
jgi:NADH-quinone oxidoreductase subunit M